MRQEFSMEWQSTITDNDIGVLTFDEERNWYTVIMNTEHGNVEVSLGCDDFENQSDLLKDLKGFCFNLNSILDSALHEFVKDLLPLKNEYWLSSSESIYTESSFLKRVKLSKISISMSEGGLAEMFFDDHGLFADHSMVVWHEEDGVVSGPHLAG